MASDAELLRQEWSHGAIDGGEPFATQFLKIGGFTLNDDKTWNRPPHNAALSRLEKSALKYLQDEFGYGELRDGQQHEA